MIPRVLTVTNMYPEPGRPAWGSFVQSQVESLRSRGVETDVMVIRGYRSKLEYLRAIPRLWIRCRRKRYDLIHAHYGLCGLVARMQVGLPVLVSYCGNDLYGHADERGRQRKLGMPLVWIQRRLAHFVDGVIVKSQSAAGMLPAVNVEVIPNGVDLSLFRPMPRRQARAALGLDDDAVYILFPYATDRPRKNYKLFQAALDSLARRHGRRALPLVIHDAPNERIPLYLNAADGLLLTSYWEGSPNAVKEAMACNTRVVAVDVGDVRELIEGHSGYEVCGFDADALADALERVLTASEPPGIRSTMQWLSVDAISERIITLYASIAGGAPRRGAA